MDLHPHAVTEAVAEIGAVARTDDDGPGGAVHRLPCGTGFGGDDARGLGGQHRLIDPPHLLSGVTHRHGTGHVGAVAVIDAAEVHSDEFPIPDGLLGGDAVGQAAVGAGDHDGVEGHVLRSVVEHQILEPGGDLLLRDAGTDLLQDAFQGLLGDALGGDEGLNLLAVLYPAQLQQQLRGGHQLAGQSLSVGLIVPDGHIGVLKAHPAEALGLHDLPQQDGVSPAGPDLLDLGVLDIAGSGLRIAGVGEIVGFPACYQSGAVGAGGVEAGGVEAVGLTGQQHGVQSEVIQFFRDLTKVIHVFSFINKTAKRRMAVYLDSAISTAAFTKP